MADGSVSMLVCTDRPIRVAAMRPPWTPDLTEWRLIESRRAMGADWNAVARMLGRPVCDVRAAVDPTFDRTFAYRPDKLAPAKVEAPKRPRYRRRRALANGMARGEISVCLLEMLRDGLVTSRAIANTLKVEPARISGKLAYCRHQGWATSSKVRRENHAVFAVTPAGLCKIQEFREARR